MVRISIVIVFFQCQVYKKSIFLADYNYTWNCIWLGNEQQQQVFINWWKRLSLIVGCAFSQSRLVLGLMQETHLSWGWSHR